MPRCVSPHKCREQEHFHLQGQVSFDYVAKQFADPASVHDVCNVFDVIHYCRKVEVSKDIQRISHDDHCLCPEFYVCPMLPSETPRIVCLRFA
jgi:hypothetical protein